MVLLVDVVLVVGWVVLGFLLFLAGVFAWLVWPAVIGATWTPTPPEVVHRMLEVAEVGQEDIVYDLGSGDGRILFVVVEGFGAEAVGIEADLVWVVWSRFKARRRGIRERVRVVWGNFFSQSLAGATVVTVFQGQGINQRLKEKFIEELKPGTRVVSHRFTFEGWKPVAVDEEARVYLYRV